MDNYLQYVGGSTGLIALTGIAAASALYFATRPKPEKPLVPLHSQSPVLEVSFNVLPLNEKGRSWSLSFCRSAELLSVLIIFGLFLSRLSDDFERVGSETRTQVSQVLQYHMMRPIVTRLPESPILSLEIVFLFKRWLKKIELEVKIGSIVKSRIARLRVKIFHIKFPLTVKSLLAKIGKKNNEEIYERNPQRECHEIRADDRMSVAQGEKNSDRLIASGWKYFMNWLDE